MITARDQYHVDEWNDEITVRSIYGGVAAGPFSSNEEAEKWIAKERIDFDRRARSDRQNSIFCK